jgi:hypothetical protein
MFLDAVAVMSMASRMLRERSSSFGAGNFEVEHEHIVLLRVRPIEPGERLRRLHPG